MAQEVNHSFLKYKKELVEYGYEVRKNIYERENGYLS